MSYTRFKDPDTVVSPDWLHEHLDEPKLRIFDCTTYLEFEESGNRPYRVVSGRSGYEDGHIPGAGYLDLQQDFSRADSPYSFTLPPVEAAVAAFEQHGVGDGTHVVLYSRTTLPWATRFWWMLRWLGFDNASVLDGGYVAWVEGGLPVSREACRYPPRKLTINPRPEIFVGKEEVLAAIDDADTCTINALSPDLYSGENARYGRPGRVPGSVNLPAASLVETGTMKLRPHSELSAVVAQTVPGSSRRVVTYCGGGIFATLDAFLLHQLGHEDVAVYDSSMSEWATDGSLPIETD